MGKKEREKGRKELQKLHDWLQAVGGNMFLGDSVLNTVEASKSGNKLTIVLKKVEAAKQSIEDDTSDL